MTRATLTPETVSIHVPFRIVKRGGRKEMQLPEGVAQARTPDSTVVKALARAFRWKRMLDTGEFVTFAEIARHEGLNPSYVHRIVLLTLLAPEVVEAILEGRQGELFSLSGALSGFPIEWKRQSFRFGV